VVNKQLVHKLALERCRVNISHLCALTHLSGEFEDDAVFVRDSLNGVFENLNRDIGLIESINVE